MALVLFADDLRARVLPSDEAIFQDLPEDDFPELTKLRAAFYDDPILTSDQAGRLVHELIDVADRSGGDPAIRHTVTRLLPFFSKAFRRSLTIRSRSD